ncbi:MAG: arginyltransferase [Deltaproteobacteria bacterium]|nr:arginyltransferase [Deltaproteobacteria bacterium]
MNQGPGPHPGVLRLPHRDEGQRLRLHPPGGAALSAEWGDRSIEPALPVPLGIPVVTAPPHECPYLPGRISVSRGFRCEKMPGGLYQALMDAGFRRSGDVFYQNVCPGCRACAALRVPCVGFEPRKSQRRVRRRNADLTLTVARPALSDEKHDLYVRYLTARHDGTMSTDREQLQEFLYRSPGETLEVCYRNPTGRLVGVGVCDLTPRALSSVYFYFAPDQARRSLGIFSATVEIDLGRRLGLAWYYPGFWVAGCHKMEYKASLRPSELLGTDGRWRPFDAGLKVRGVSPEP